MNTAAGIGPAAVTLPRDSAFLLGLFSTRYRKGFVGGFCLLERGLESTELGVIDRPCLVLIHLCPNLAELTILTGLHGTQLTVPVLSN